MEGIAITVADEGEARACLALLPEAQSAPVELLIARLDGAFAGAAGTHWQSWSNPAGFPASLRVLPPFRRRGVGRALIAALADLVAEETDGLWSHTRVEPGDEAERFLMAVGAAAKRREHYFDAGTHALLAHIHPLLRRLKRDVGSKFAAIPLADAPLEEVGWLISGELGGGPLAALSRIRARAALTPAGSTDTSRRDRSLAVMYGAEVAGVIIWRMDDDGSATVDARIVAPRWRGGLVNLALLEAGLSAGIAEGAERVRFHCEDTVLDTIKLARRCGAAETIRGIYYYPATAVAGM